MISQRDAFFNKLFTLAEGDKRIVVISADMGAPSLDQWRLSLPHQFINVGVAEQNAINVATGMALSGFIPFVYAIAPFVSLRVVEQIKIGPALHSLPITIVGIGAGLSYADAGPTHHNIEDLRIISSIPNMTVINCTDSAMAAILPELSLTNLPLYIRLDREVRPPLYPYITLQDIEHEYPITEIVSGTPSKSHYVISCGDLFHSVMRTCVELGIHCVDLFRIPILESLKSRLPEKANILVLEEGIGLASAVLEFSAFHDLKWDINFITIPNYIEDYGGRKLMRMWHGMGESDLKVIIHEWRVSGN